MYFFIFISPLIGVDYKEIIAFKLRHYKLDMTLDAFLKFSEYEILTNAGKISHEVAKELALGEYAKYKPIQDKITFLFLIGK